MKNTEVEDIVEQVLQGARYVTGNQYPEDCNEYKAYQAGFESALAMVYIELTGTSKTKGKLEQALTKAKEEEREKCIGIIEASTRHIQPLPDDAEEVMGDFERGTVGGGEYAKRIILEALTPKE